MIRMPAIAAAALLALAPATAFAQSGVYYAATPVASPAKPSLVTRTTIWKCTGGTCVAPKGNSRDNIMCELVAREVGQLTAFRANGTDFDGEALAKCNAKVR